MVGGADEHDFGPCFSQQFAVIAKYLRSLFGRLTSGDEFTRDVRRLPVHVAQADDFDRRNLDQVKQVRLSVPTAPDERDAQRLIFFGAKEAGFRDRRSHGSSTNCFQEIAASHMSGKDYSTRV